MVIELKVLYNSANWVNSDEMSLRTGFIKNAIQNMFKSKTKQTPPQVPPPVPQHQTQTQNNWLTIKKIDIQDALGSGLFLETWPEMFYVDSR